MMSEISENFVSSPQVGSLPPEVFSENGKVVQIYYGSYSLISLLMALLHQGRLTCVQMIPASVLDDVIEDLALHYGRRFDRDIPVTFTPSPILIGSLVIAKGESHFEGPMLIRLGNPFQPDADIAHIEVLIKGSLTFHLTTDFRISAKLAAVDIVDVTRCNVFFKSDS